MMLSVTFPLDKSACKVLEPKRSQNDDIHSFAGQRSRNELMCSKLSIE